MHGVGKSKIAPEKLRGEEDGGVDNQLGILDVIPSRYKKHKGRE